MFSKYSVVNVPVLDAKEHSLPIASLVVPREISELGFKECTSWVTTMLINKSNMLGLSGLSVTRIETKYENGEDVDQIINVYGANVYEPVVFDLNITDEMN